MSRADKYSKQRIDRLKELCINLDGVKSTETNKDNINITAIYKYVPILKQSEINSIIYKEKIKKFKLVKSKEEG